MIFIYRNIFVGTRLIVFLHKNKKYIFGGLLFFSIPICLFIDRFIKTFFLSDISSIGHLDFATGAIKLWLISPIFGIGAGTFEQSYIKLIAPALTNAYSHSIYLQWLAETGIFGLAANLIFIGLIIKNSVVTILGLSLRGKLKLFQQEKIELLGLICAFLVLVIANIFYAYFINLPTYILIGMILGNIYRRNYAK